MSDSGIQYHVLVVGYDSDAWEQLVMLERTYRDEVSMVLERAENITGGDLAFQCTENSAILADCIIRYDTVFRDRNSFTFII